ncbi:hypothetical protein D3C75_864750 [compost metagenome]
MVFSYITFLLFVPTKQREVNNPSKFKYIIVDQTKLTADFKTQCAKNVGYYFFVVCGEKQQVSFFCACTSFKIFDFLLSEELNDRSAEFAFLHLNPCKTFCTVTGCIGTQIINIFTAPSSAAFSVQYFNLSAFFDNRSKYLYTTSRYKIANILQFQAKTQIRLI